MIIKMITFSLNGVEVIKEFASKIDDKLNTVRGFVKCSNYHEDNKLISKIDDVNEIIAASFADHSAIVFVSAVGIAVRYIAPFVADKLNDCPVVVVDDKKTFAIPILSGHFGGANKLAGTISEILGTVPVITTSSDVNDSFSVDSFAEENNLNIVNRKMIKKISAKAIEGKPLVLSIKDFPAMDADVIVTDDMNANIISDKALILKQKKYVVGIGLKKDKEFEVVEELFLSVLEDNNIDVSDVYAIASIDVKEEEKALATLSVKYRMPRIFFDAASLKKAKGNFTPSKFVLETVGVDNVCERAAVLGAHLATRYGMVSISGKRGELVANKVTKNGVAIAVAMM